MMAALNLQTRLNAPALFLVHTCRSIKIIYVAQDEEKGRALAAEIAEISAPYSLTYEGVWLQGDAPKEILSFADLQRYRPYHHGRFFARQAS